MRRVVRHAAPKQAPHLRLVVAREAARGHVLAQKPRVREKKHIVLALQEAPRVGRVALVLLRADPLAHIAFGRPHTQAVQIDVAAVCAQLERRHTVLVVQDGAKLQRHVPELVLHARHHQRRQLVQQREVVVAAVVDVRGAVGGGLAVGAGARVVACGRGHVAHGQAGDVDVEARVDVDEAGVDVVHAVGAAAHGDAGAHVDEERRHAAKGNVFAVFVVVVAHVLHDQGLVELPRQAVQVAERHLHVGVGVPGEGHAVPVPQQKQAVGDPGDEAVRAAKVQVVLQEAVERHHLAVGVEREAVEKAPVVVVAQKPQRVQVEEARLVEQFGRVGRAEQVPEQRGVGGGHGVVRLLLDALGLARRVHLEPQRVERELRRDLRVRHRGRLRKKGAVRLEHVGAGVFIFIVVVVTFKAFEHALDDAVVQEPRVETVRARHIHMVRAVAVGQKHHLSRRRRAVEQVELAQEAGVFARLRAGKPRDAEPDRRRPVLVAVLPHGNHGQVAGLLGRKREELFAQRLFRHKHVLVHRAQVHPVRPVERHFLARVRARPVQVRPEREARVERLHGRARGAGVDKILGHLHLDRRRVVGREKVKRVRFVALDVFLHERLHRLVEGGVRVERHAGAGDFVVPDAEIEEKPVSRRRKDKVHAGVRQHER